MAALNPVPRCFELIWIGNDGGDTNIENHTFWGFNGALSATDAQTIVEAAYNQWVTHMLPLQGAWFELEECFLNDISSKQGVQSAFTGSALGTSGGTGKLTSASAFVLSFEGSYKYRGGHSRIYIAGQASSDMTDPNSFTTGHATGMVNGWGALRTALIAAIPTAVQIVGQVIAHRYGASADAPVLAASGRSLRSVPLANPWTEPVIATRGNLSAGSQRRRNLYEA